ncbi:hypothetical protein EMPS_03711 [Entomortierella parvispora]|uniref:Protein-tyrosine-phosphatase n=1 Tax=Entomortierella parvispora TaxID=205924 RepID=A0A9P3H761_9FUNG|nr:hypothetical protein EMPS_03711 [Entomortierella parvispora]
MMVTSAIPPDLRDPLSSPPSPSPYPSPISTSRPDAGGLDSLPLVSSQPPVRALDANQVFQLHQKSVTTPLPSRMLFPWLHGVDGTSGAQNYFFGIDLQHQQQEQQPQQFFAASGGQAGDCAAQTPPMATTGQLPLPDHRGLMFVHVNELDPGRLVGSVGPSEILQPVIPSARSSPVASTTPMFIATTTTTTTTTATIDAKGHAVVVAPVVSTHDINHHPQIHQQYSAVSAVHQQQKDQQQQQEGGGSDWSDISDDSSSNSSVGSTTSPFAPPSSSQNNNSQNAENRHPIQNPFADRLQCKFLHSLSDGINIRNFKIQVPRYALLSDLILYTKDGERDPILILVAQQISKAQDLVWREMKEQYPQLSIHARRHTFVLSESFQSFESKFPELVAVSSSGQATKNRVDFWDQEREQMSLLTRASEIAPGVWLGNNADVPQVTNNRSMSSSSSLVSPVTPGTSFSSYFFPSSSSSIPNKNGPSTANRSSSIAIPSTPPPDENAYPPLTPPSFNDQTNFHPSICVECKPGNNLPTQFTLDRIRGNVGGTPAPLPVKEIFQLECLGTLTSSVNPELFPPSISSLSSLAGQITVDISSNHAVRRSTASDLVSGHQLARSILQSQVTQLINMAFFVQSVASPSTSINAEHEGHNLKGRRHSNQKQQQQHRDHAHQVLIHCMDGYTETALLALAVVMVHYRLSLAEAYLKLQTDLGRSFFVYPNDSIMMLEVEKQIWQRIHAQDRAEREAAQLATAQQQQQQQQREQTRERTISTSSSVSSKAITTSATAGESAAVVKSSSAGNAALISSGVSLSPSPGSSPPSSSSGMSSLSSSLSSSSSFFSSLLNMNGSSASGSAPNQQQQQQPQQQPTLPPKTDTMEGIERSRESEGQQAIQIELDEDEFVDSEVPPFLKPGHEQAFSWFYNPEFEGSFPSRILSFLYLGNLAHASNPGLLKSLGIQYVLSVGEEAHGLADAEYSSVDDGAQDKNAMMDVESQPQRLDTHTQPKRFMVKLVDDMYDNGVDSLWRHLENCVDFVDEARRANSRILIHCRVGVSRSATIVIAYLMAHYHLSLVDAYLMVRARRLSVIIQPNLLFMYELLQWEQQLKGRFDPMGWPGVAREVHSLNMYYIGS